MKTLIIRNDELCPPGSLTAPLEASGQLVEWQAHRGGAGSLEGIDAVVALGGGTNPDEDQRCPWLITERSLLADAIRRDIPILGICLGAQLIAQVLGALVRPLEAIDVGWQMTPFQRAADHDQLFRDLPRSPVLLQWHEYGFSLPPGATLLAGTAERANAFRYADRFWAMQFHIEADEFLATTWASAHVSKLRCLGIEPDDLEQQSRRHAAAQVEICRAVTVAFAGVCRSAGAVRSAV